MPSRSPTGVIVNTFTVPTMSVCWPKSAGVAKPARGMGGGVWASAVVARRAKQALAMISFLISGLLSSCPFPRSGHASFWLHCRTPFGRYAGFFALFRFAGVRLNEVAEAEVEVDPDHRVSAPVRVPD